MTLTQKLCSFPRVFVDTVRMEPSQFLTWIVCWSCWTLGSLQYYVLPFTLSDVATYLDVPQTKVSEANTTTMLSRAIGALIFGIISDQYGRKIPLIIDLVFLGVFSMCTGFIKTYGQLIGCRLLFGIAYGGTYGLVMAMVLEAVPRRARGVVAGFTQQGFSAGYLFASGLHLAMNNYGWRSLFWLGAGLAVPVIVLRTCSQHISVTNQVIEETEGVESVDARTAVGGNLSFVKKFKFLIMHHPKAFAYACCLSGCLATMGHGTMDLYPTFLTTQRHLDVKHETWVTVILQIGGIMGGVVGGFFSHRVSPKWIAAGSAILCAPWLPLWVLPSKWNYLAVGAFFLQFFYGAAIGNLGNLMQQICPHPGMRAAFTGVSYNIGNAVSSIAPTIETALGEKFPTPDGGPDYGRTQMILVGIVICFLVVTLVSMPLKSLNKAWDEVDPNMAIPTGDNNQKADMEMVDKVVSPNKEASKVSDLQVAHVEQVQLVEGATKA
ncbi:Putative sialic acid transporter [Talaromyces islandicus]|uniref:Putative sialic acid transporter n=1 Tax=Talaromyces islandicus TaxID=28573 RepID=A0A0U1LWS7_TALIS|nr:Putative sialic acid transporter [Talaromyces islandicus]